MEKIEKQGEITERITKEKEKIKPKTATPQGGRPQNKQDTNVRKKRVDTPRDTPGVAELSSWLNITYDSLENLSDGYLKFKDKKNRRQLSKAEMQELIDIKFRVLTNLPVLSKATDASIYKVLQENKPLPRSIAIAAEKHGFTLENTPKFEYESIMIGLCLDYFSSSCSTNLH
jgi:hypothetical protein